MRTRASDTPDPAWQFITCYGVRYRTEDLIFTTLEGTIGIIAAEGVDASSYNSFVFCLGALKIGGTAPSLAGDPERAGAMGAFRYLCSLPCILPRYDSLFPWVNQREPISILNAMRPDDTLFFWDGFNIDFFIDPAMRMTAIIEK